VSGEGACLCVYEAEVLAALLATETLDVQCEGMMAGAWPAWVRCYDPDAAEPKSEHGDNLALTSHNRATSFTRLTAIGLGLPLGSGSPARMLVIIGYVGP
jgi:hypothetical protein